MSAMSTISPATILIITTSMLIITTINGSWYMYDSMSCCVILILLALCGVLFVKINKETVEEILIKRYMSGRGASLSNIQIFNKHIQSNDSNDSIDISHMNQSIQYSDRIQSINQWVELNNMDSNYENINDNITRSPDVNNMQVNNNMGNKYDVINNKSYILINETLC
eukprot:186722_1